MKIIKKIKDKLYYFLVEKNGAICDEYKAYVDTHQHIHQNCRLKSWWLLIKLNFNYRLIRNNKSIMSKNTNKRKIRLPYLDGAESEAFRRPEPIFFAKDLLKYDVISFDIFDTLILRSFAKPADLFAIVGHELNYINFYTIRIEAERKARKIAMERKGNREVNIYDIYDIIEKETGIDKNLGVETELKVEMQFCFANPYMMRVFKLLKEQNKEIIFVSDMYLPQDMMVKLLESCGYVNYSKLYVSCDFDCNKSLGGLYEKVLEQYDKNISIVHIGDNIHSDINIASKLGIDTRYYKNVHEVGNIYRADGMSNLIGSIYSGIINTHLHNGIKTYSPQYEYGFIYGGLYITGYCNWMYQKAKTEGIDKIIFLSRDGYIYQKVFNIMFNDMPNEYMYWSRVANCKYACNFQKKDIVKKLVLDRTVNGNDTYKFTVNDLIQGFNLQKLIPYLRNYNLNLDILINSENCENVCDLLYENWDIFIESHKAEREILHEFIKMTLKDCKKIAIVDVGWMASGPLGLKELIINEWNIECDVKCWVAGHMHRDFAALDDMQLNNIVESYMFSYCYNRSNYDTQFVKRYATPNVMCFELFTQAPTPSYAGINEDGDYLFEAPEIESYEGINEIHSGILEFAKIYFKVSSEHKYLLNISGHDAFCSFRMIIRDKKYTFINEFLGDMSFNRTIMASSEKKEMKSVKENIKEFVK